MRWFSCFALVCYLCLLCTPQAFAVQDLRIAPLADNQLQALISNAYFSHCEQVNQQDDKPPTGFISQPIVIPTLVVNSVSAMLAQDYQLILF
ncbi:hypothetical protein [Rheinheimera sp. WS51]|uniref:hypothetical protein n=1 Tax=Rheinheimera sp. WS51 TaxID=3425886 RepID=UPI003D8BBC80